jgi:hypothetical protein
MKKELIDFARWYMDQSAIRSPEEMVFRYLSQKSINSEASSEARSVSDNEAKKKKCSLGRNRLDCEFNEDDILCSICPYAE